MSDSYDISESLLSKYFDKNMPKKLTSELLTSYVDKVMEADSKLKKAYNVAVENQKNTSPSSIAAVAAENYNVVAATKEMAGLMQWCRESLDAQQTELNRKDKTNTNKPLGFRERLANQRNQDTEQSR